MRHWGRLIALGALLAASGGAVGQRQGHGEYLVVDEAEAEEPDAAPAPKVGPAVVERQPLELERAEREREARRQVEVRRANRVLAGFTSPRLIRFADDAEFARYVAAVKTLEEVRYASRKGLMFAQAEAPSQTATDAAEPVCPPEDPDCLSEEDDAGQIIVTGSRINPRNPSITNNQLAGVEEGDIVKQIDHYLLILQDGRIFVADIRAGGGRGLALVDRVNVYRDPKSDSWYDEMLVFGDRVLVTGYSYEEQASELAVFRLDLGGRLIAEGVFHMPSSDYYDVENYATRLIGDRLIIYTPFEASEMSDDPESPEWPLIRRWLPEEDKEAARKRGTPRFHARDIYRPVRDTNDPYVHAVSICPLSTVGSARDLSCRTTAFVAPANAEWYVDESDVYLWTSLGHDDERDQCPGETRPALARSQTALLHRVPLSGAAPAVLATIGRPNDQFSFEVIGGRFHALLQLEPRDCYPEWSAPAHLAYFSTPLSSLGATVRDAPLSRYAELPSTGTRWIANRFTDRYLVYGGLSSYRSGLPIVDWDEYKGDPERTRYLRQRLAMPPAYAVPLNRPGGARKLDLKQTVIRAERVGDDILLSGYRNREGLRLAYVDLAGTPRIASTLELPGRFESEGRSHAFNSLTGPDGSGLLGLPTVPTTAEAGRWWWRSRSSDLSFIRLDRRRGMSRLGELRGRFSYSEDDDDGSPDYKCEVSCIDWYGNSRPIFTDGRLFGLSGTELIEGSVAGPRIVETARLDLTRPPAGRAAQASAR